MLVLSRKKDQKILFPHLGIEVDVLRIAGKSVSIGINAPKSVQILRGELANNPAVNNPAVSIPAVSDAAVSDAAVSDAAVSDAVQHSDSEAREVRHQMRNQLHKAQLAVAIAQKQLQKGRSQDAEQTLRELLVRLTEIDQQIVAPGMASKTHDSNASNKARRALIVEDDANERALMAGYLGLYGFEINEAADGVEAMEFLDENQVDLVVLDMRMPRMNGMETAQEIRRRSSLRHTKIVVVSGEDREDSVVTGDDRGLTEWFSKPLDASGFASYLDANLN